jgi:hypothetical protein
MKRLLALFSLLFGFLGVVACLAGTYAVCVVGSRLQQTNEVVFALMDRTLLSAQDRVRGVQQRVKDLRITTSEINQRLRDWTKRKTEERLVSQLEIEKRAEKVAGYLQAADSVLETASESIQGIQQLLALGSSLGASVDPASLTDVLEKLQEIRARLQTIEGTVDQIREFTAGAEDESKVTRLARVTKLLVRATLTMTEIDPYLENLHTRLVELRTDGAQMQARTSRRILLATITCCLLLAWIAAGQVALCVYGWRKGWKRSG